jgi:hypothetical protein
LVLVGRPVIPWPETTPMLVAGSSLPEQNYKVIILNSGSAKYLFRKAG